MNWVDFHRDHYFKLAKNTFKTIPYGDTIEAELSQNQNFWEKFLMSLKTLNCGVGGNRIRCFMVCT